MTQSYRPDFVSEGFRPNQAPDYDRGLAERDARFRAADAAIVQQMQADKQTIALNSREQMEGAKKLAAFSNTLFKFVDKQGEEYMKNEEAEGMLYAQENPSTLQPDAITETGDKKEAQEINSAAAKTRPQDADVVVPAVRGSRYFRRGYAKGRAMQMAQTEYRPFIEEYVAKRGYTDSADLAVAVAEAKKAFWSQAGINRKDLGAEFQATKLFPTLNKIDADITNDLRSGIAKEQSFALQTEALTKLSNDGDIASYLGAVAASTDSNNKRLGFRGAWALWVTNVASGLKNGTISATQLEAMKGQKIPGDPKGRTYGELHGDKFATAEMEARKARVNQWNLEQSERRATGQQQEQALLDAFLDPNDTDGYTDAQIEEAIDKLEKQNPGFEANNLRRLLKTTVDSKTREKQDEEIQGLLSLGLLTPERLAKFDRKLQAKYRTQAQQQARASAENGGFKSQLGVLSQAARAGTDSQPITVAPGASVKPSVGMWEIKLHQMFQNKVAQGIPPDQALNETLLYHQENAKISANGYMMTDPITGKLRSIMPNANDVSTATIIREQRQFEINEALRNPGSINKPFGFFDEAQLTDIIKGYGKPGWSPGAEATYIASKLKMDPISVINAQLKASGMGDRELKMTPAMEVAANELTPNQRAALARIGNTEVSSRVMGSFGQFREELIPSGYGPMVTKAASSAGLQPAMVAAMAEIESGWDAGTPSYNGSSFGLMQINRDAHPLFFQQNDWKDPQANLNYGAQYYSSLLKMYKGDAVAAAMAYNAGPGNYEAYLRGEMPDGRKKTEMINHGKKFQQALYKYGGGTGSLQSPQAMRGTTNKLTASAQSYVGMDTSEGPDAGNNACVYAVNKVLARAGVDIPWGNSVYVPYVKGVLDKSARRLDGPQPGAIVIMQDNGSPPYPHIGIVQADGRIISNSSSRAKFDWIDTPEAYERKYGRPNLYYQM